MFKKTKHDLKLSRMYSVAECTQSQNGFLSIRRDVVESRVAVVMKGILQMLPIVT